MPNPGKKEKQDAFIARYMGDEEAKKKFPDEKQRLAVAYSEWKAAKKKMAANESVEVFNEVRHYPAGSSKGGQFMPSRGGGLAKGSPPPSGSSAASQAAHAVGGLSFKTQGVRHFQKGLSGKDARSGMSAIHLQFKKDGATQTASGPNWSVYSKKGQPYTARVSTELDKGTGKYSLTVKVE